MNKITVIGSINTDLVFISDVRPSSGETVIGSDFKINPGGKGANQAVAAAKLGAEVQMIGCIGNDSNGQMCLNNFKTMGVNTDYIEIIENVPSGVASITVAEGDNSIIVIAGANHSLTPDIVLKYKNIILSSDMVLIQLEIPIATVEFISDLCCQNNVPVMLNPAPAVRLSQNIIDAADYITPNEHECKIIFGRDEHDGIEDLFERYSGKLIVTQGSKGAKYHDGNQIITVPAFKTNAVDTTGAGDTFNGALASALIRGLSLSDSILFANKAASISVTKYGAQGGMPVLEEVTASFGS